MILGALEGQEVSLDDSLIFPVSLSSTWMIGAMLDAGDARTISKNTWSPDKKSLPVDKRTKSILFIEPLLWKESDSLRNAGSWLDSLARKRKVSKLLKGLPRRVVCWFTDFNYKEAQKGVPITCALHVQESGHIDLHGSHAMLETGKKMDLDVAIGDAGWDQEFAFMEKHEVVLDKLKTELWD